MKQNFVPILWILDQIMRRNKGIRSCCCKSYYYWAEGVVQQFSPYKINLIVQYDGFESFISFKPYSAREYWQLRFCWKRPAFIPWRKSDLELILSVGFVNKQVVWNIIANNKVWLSYGWIRCISNRYGVPNNIRTYSNNYTMGEIFMQ